MGRSALIGRVLSVCFIALIPSVGATQTGVVKSLMAALRADADALGAPKFQGNALYFGNTEVSADLVDAAVKMEVLHPVERERGELRNCERGFATVSDSCSFRLLARERVRSLAPH
jgi:hypothetical protein